MSKIRFNNELNVGHLLQVGALLAALLAGYYAIRGDVTLLNSRLDKVELTLQQLTAVIVADAKQGEQIISLSGRVDRLERAHERLSTSSTPR